MPRRISAILVAIALIGFWILVASPRPGLDVRRGLIRSMVTWDAVPTEPAPLPGGVGPGLPEVARTRVVLIDGLSATTAASLPSWSALCNRGTALGVDVGFPTVSLTVEVALWSGLTQQQTGVMFHSDRPLDPPLDRRGIPAQVPRSRAIAEHHGWIVRSLGFAQVEPVADPARASADAEPEVWAQLWESRALDAVKGDSPLVFVHILRVDAAGHRDGRGASYDKAAREADAILGKLVAADPQARWFALSDHGHLPGGGHGGEERSIRHVRGCIAGPDVSVASATRVHIVDVARAIADSTGATLDPASRGRPLPVAVAHPIGEDQSVPAIALGPGAVALFVLVAGLVVSSWGVRRWWMAPWWLFTACALLIAVRGMPTMSTPMIYKPAGRDMYLTWLPALGLAFVTSWLGLRATTLARLVIAQLALPIAAAAAVVTACGGWPAVFGAQLAPVVPRYSAWVSPLLLMVSQGALAVALGVLANFVPRRFGRPAPAEPPRTEPEAG
ncbi:MAG: hypothetical protein AB7P03_14610 [Kofleriaceae bacterium]